MEQEIALLKDQNARMKELTEQAQRRVQEQDQKISKFLDNMHLTLQSLLNNMDLAANTIENLHQATWNISTIARENVEALRK
jgi:ABC-type transporter Mla subunit MlaD